MKTFPKPARLLAACLGAAASLAVLTSSIMHADQLELVNGDRYIGDVIAVNLTNVTLRSEINGLMQIPRTKVTTITFGNAPAPAASARSQAPAPPVPAAVVPNAPDADLAAQIKAHGIDPKTVKQVQEQILGAATPDATAKFNEMVGGLATGKLSIEDIRNQARSLVKELQSTRAELGDEFGSLLDGYLNILQSFLGEAGAPTDKSGKESGKPAKPGLLDEEE